MYVMEVTVSHRHSVPLIINVVALTFGRQMSLYSGCGEALSEAEWLQNASGGRKRRGK